MNQSKRPTEPCNYSCQSTFELTFQFLKQIIWSLDRLFQKKNSRYLELSTQLKRVPWSCDSSSYRESTVDLFRRIRSLSNIMFTSLIDYFSKQEKGKKDIKRNCRPVSILPKLKIFENRIFKQVSHFFDNILSKYQCGFSKGFNTQHCLLAMLEKWERYVDNSKTFGALLTNLSKAFDCLDHELLIAKLKAVAFSLAALKLIHDYLSNMKQQTKINLSYISFHEIIFGVSQG